MARGYSRNVLLLLLLVATVAAPASAEKGGKGGGGGRRGPPPLDAATEVANLLDFLANNGYANYADAINTLGLSSTLETALTTTRGLTVMAPTDDVFTGLPDAACANQTYAVLVHVLIYVCNDWQPNGWKPTLTPVPVTVTRRRWQSTPTTVSITDGLRNVATSADVTSPNVYKTNYVTVQGINAVLQYPSGLDC